jgi:hypothetical protein
MDWLHLAFMGALYVAGAITIALLGLVVVRAIVPHHVLAEHNDVAGFVYATIAVTYAVILGFVTITVWEEFEEARDTADQEANAVADLMRLAQWFPDGQQVQIESALAAYAVSVVDDEWDAMEEGDAPAEATNAAFDHLWTLYEQYEPGPGSEEIAYGDSLDRMQDLGNARRMRLLESEEGIPGILWAGLIFGGALTVAFAFAFGVERGQSHGLLLATLAATVALLLFIVSSLNYAFHGDVRIEPTGMELVLQQAGIR